MATNTYIALDKVTVGTATPSITFNSIPSTYTDLVIVASFKAASTTIVTPAIRFNGDTNTNYSNTSMYSNASTMTSYRWANTNKLFLGDFYAGVSSNAFIPYTIHINSYGNTSVYKTVLCRYNQINSANGEIGETVGMWRSTSAINSVTITSDGGQNFAVGSTFSLYGIKAWANTEASPKAVGGYVSSTSTHWIHSFPFSGTFTPTATITGAEYLVIAGGGGGGENAGAGGGAGGYRCSVVGEMSGGGASAESTRTFTNGTAYTITVGAGGGYGGNGGITNGSRRNGSNGTGSSITGTGFTAITTTGGGGGSAGGSGPVTFNGAAGGSGGGSCVYPSGSNSGGAGTANEGYRGANTAGYLWGGGGGGAGGTGVDINSGSSGGTLGGIGVASSITGTSIYRAGGGSGYGLAQASLGGTKAVTNGAVSTGAGAGEYAQGGSGIVIIRYPK